MWIFGYGSLVWKADFPYVKKVVGYVKGYERKFWQASIDHRGVPEKPGRVVTLVPSADPNTKVWGTAYKIHRRDIDFVIRHLDMREVMGYEKVPEEFHPIPDHPLNVFEMDSLSSSYSSNLGSTGSNNASPGLINSSSFSNSDSDSGHSSSALSPDPDMEGEEELTSAMLSEPTSDLDSDDTDDDEFYEDVKAGRKIRVLMYFGSETNEHFIGPAPVDEIAVQIFECTGHSGRNRDYLFNLAAAMREICAEAVDSHLSVLEKAVRSLENGQKSKLVGGIRSLHDREL